jgi:hypothetical protein
VVDGIHLDRDQHHKLGEVIAAEAARILELEALIIMVQGLARCTPAAKQIEEPFSKGEIVCVISEIELHTHLNRMGLDGMPMQGDPACFIVLPAHSHKTVSQKEAPCVRQGVGNAGHEFVCKEPIAATGRGETGQGDIMGLETDAAQACPHIGPDPDANGDVVKEINRRPPHVIVTRKIAAAPGETDMIRIASAVHDLPFDPEIAVSVPQPSADAGPPLGLGLPR